MKKNRSEKLLYTTQEAAAVLGISASALEKYRAAGTGPTFVRPEGGRRIGYPRAELEKWIATRSRITRRQMARQRRAQAKLGFSPSAS